MVFANGPGEWLNDIARPTLYAERDILHVDCPRDAAKPPERGPARMADTRARDLEWRRHRKCSFDDWSFCVADKALIDSSRRWTGRPRREKEV